LRVVRVLNHSNISFAQKGSCERSLVSVAHPAKANLFLIHFLLQRYTKKGDVVADIMAGTGSTGIVASYMGRHAVLVELEEKFVKWIEKNVELLEKHGGKRGEIKVIQGDARKLAELLGVKTDSIVTSPPYSNVDPTHFASGSLAAKRGNFREKRVELVKREGYSDNPENIGNLPHGEIDAGTQPSLNWLRQGRCLRTQETTT